MDQLDRVGLVEDLIQLVRELKNKQVDTLWDYDEFLLDLDALYEYCLANE